MERWVGVECNSNKSLSSSRSTSNVGSTPYRPDLCRKRPKRRRRIAGRYPHLVQSRLPPAIGGDGNQRAGHRRRGRGDASRRRVGGGSGTLRSRRHARERFQDEPSGREIIAAIARSSQTIRCRSCSIRCSARGVATTRQQDVIVASARAAHSADYGVTSSMEARRLAQEVGRERVSALDGARVACSGAECVLITGTREYVQCATACTVETVSCVPTAGSVWPAVIHGSSCMASALAATLANRLDVRKRCATRRIPQALSFALSTGHGAAHAGSPVRARDDERRCRARLTGCTRSRLRRRTMRGCSSAWSRRCMSASLVRYRAKDADRHTRYTQAQRLLERAAASAFRC